MIKIRETGQEDLMIYFNWVSDPEVRKNTINKDCITLENHKKWFSKHLASNDCHMYIIESEGQPIGQVRFDLEGYVGEISYSLDKTHRGKGLGKQVITMAIDELVSIGSEIKELQARVLKTNTPSIKIFEKLGFDKIAPDKLDDPFCYRIQAEKFIGIKADI